MLLGSMHFMMLRNNKAVLLEHCSTICSSMYQPSWRSVVAKCMMSSSAKQTANTSMNMVLAWILVVGTRKKEILTLDNREPVFTCQPRDASFLPVTPNPPPSLTSLTTGCCQGSKNRNCIGASAWLRSVSDTCHAAGVC